MLEVLEQPLGEERPGDHVRGAEHAGEPGHARAAPLLLARTQRLHHPHVVLDVRVADEPRHAAGGQHWHVHKRRRGAGGGGRVAEDGERVGQQRRHHHRRLRHDQRADGAEQQRPHHHARLPVGVDGPGAEHGGERPVEPVPRKPHGGREGRGGGGASRRRGYPRVRGRRSHRGRRGMAGGAAVGVAGLGLLGRGRRLRVSAVDGGVRGGADAEAGLARQPPAARGGRGRLGAAVGFAAPARVDFDRGEGASERRQGGLGRVRVEGGGPAELGRVGRPHRVVVGCSGSFVPRRLGG
mmetsp:Transcript_35448/g.114195  ORF Transcript_35448/g.114195 Transcript_35448/m.114195 type:complete len:296 (-) Transcript_35448:654-1541(-)